MAVSYMFASIVGGVLCCIAGVCLAHVFTASRAAQSMRRMSPGVGSAHKSGWQNGSSSSDNPSVTANHSGSAGAGSGAGDGMPVSFEPTPITAEIPMVPDPVTGEVH